MHIYAKCCFSYIIWEIISTLPAKFWYWRKDPGLIQIERRCLSTFNGPWGLFLVWSVSVPSTYCCVTHNLYHNFNIILTLPYIISLIRISIGDSSESQFCFHKYIRHKSETTSAHTNKRKLMLFIILSN